MLSQTSPVQVPEVLLEVEPPLVVVWAARGSCPGEGMLLFLFKLALERGLTL